MNTSDDFLDDDEFSSLPEEQSSTPAVGGDTEIEVEIADDTPPADRGKLDDPAAFVDTTDNEAQQYSANIQKRLNTLTAKAETERRAREKLEREHNEATFLLRQMLEEREQQVARTQELEQRLRRGDALFVDRVKSGLEAELKVARQALSKAIELGDIEAQADAQINIAKVTGQLNLAENYTPPPENPAPAREREPARTAPPAPAPVKDPMYDAWVARNTWFTDGEQTEMQAVAKAVHQKLVSQGVHPIHDAAEYYRKIDTTMRQRFPEYAWANKETRTPKQTTVTSAPTASRTAKTRVVLTKSQVSMAETLGLTPQQYAAEVQKLNRSRGE